MSTTIMTSPHEARGARGLSAVARIAGMVSAVGGATGRWPWPLPVNSVLAVFDDRAAAMNARAALTDAGIGADDMWQVSGEAGARWLRQTFSERGVPARLLSLLGDEHEIVARLEAMSLRGAAVMLVQAPRGQVRDVLEIVADHQARAVRRTGRWTTEWRTRAGW